MIAPARTAALDAVRAIAAGHADLPAALALTRQRLADGRDRALAAEIVIGTLRWQRSSDHLIQHYAARELSQMDMDVVHILRLSIYQILHLDRVPASAVVDDAVNLARQARKSAASGFVNAVLRGMLRERHRLPLPGRPADPSDRAQALAYLGVTHSHPEWLVRRWLDRYGLNAAERWVRFNNETPRLTLRVNTLRAQREDVAAALSLGHVETEPTRYAPYGLIVAAGNPLRTPGDGSFYVQDEGSQLVALGVGARPGERVLDLCAAPGGKTVALAGQMAGTGLVVACDVRARRIRLLRETVSTSGAASIRVVHVDRIGALPFRPGFDRVLVDAPCSGLGTIRRDPDIRWRRKEDDLAALADAQRVLLDRASEVVRAGGRLVYATCSSEPEENEQVVDAFLQRHGEFTPMDIRAESSLLAPLVDGRGMLNTRPFDHGLEAFFAAAMRRER